MLIKVETVCPFCGRVDSVVVLEEDFENYVNGGLVQECFPYLTQDERERLISGICPSCWDGMFSGLEGEEEEDEIFFFDLPDPAL